MNRTVSMLLLLTLAACAAAVGCARERTEPDSPTAAAVADAVNPPDQELFDSVVTESRDGRRSWILHSDRTERWVDVDDAELYQVHMDFFRADTLHSTLTSDRGRANSRTKDLFAWGNVVVVTRDGRRLETEELKYANADGRISNDVFNRFTRGEDVMTGYGMIATPDLDTFELLRDVKAEVRGETREPRR
ncbi:LPS export ABC transporter periplasmic protein LptC [bacterium]|nr:LPS export ABC transporter periplasmic protein LptC [bacterium]HPF34588.1 LPS export ABC transporter periplasmic protein LptC [Candidatus Krumholzibacteria bacterium]HRX50377.1 LPS export ABC transporter periplasmic protein LptC [Candidatus Krumholzibacteria bacterium]